MDTPVRVDPLGVDITVFISTCIFPRYYCPPRSVGNYLRISLVPGIRTDRFAVGRPAGMDTPVSINSVGVDIIITVSIVPPGDYSSP